MNLPNRLTVTRLVLAPVFFLWYFVTDVFKISFIPYSAVLVLIYGLMELTDLLDGKIARKYNLTTDLGKVMDPFGDVISHLTFFTCFLVSSIMPVWAFIIILWREFSQSFMRMLLMGKGKPLAANIFGKLKTVFYAVCSVCSITFRIIMVFGTGNSQLYTSVHSIITAFFGLASVFSVLSFVIYVKAVKDSGVLRSMTR